MRAADLITAAVLAVAVGGGAFIVSRANINLTMRNWLHRNSKQAKTEALRSAWTWGKASELVGCPFCLSVWMAGVACLLYHVHLVHGYGPLDWLVSTLAVSAASMLPVHVIDLAVAPSLMPPTLRKEDIRR